MEEKSYGMYMSNTDNKHGERAEENQRKREALQKWQVSAYMGW